MTKRIYILRLQKSVMVREMIVVPMYQNYVDAKSNRVEHSGQTGNLWMLDNLRSCKRWWSA